MRKWEDHQRALARHFRDSFCWAFCFTCSRREPMLKYEVAHEVAMMSGPGPAPTECHREWDGEEDGGGEDIGAVSMQTLRHGASGLVAHAPRLPHGGHEPERPAQRATEGQGNREGKRKGRQARGRQRTEGRKAGDTAVFQVRHIRANCRSWQGACRRPASIRMGGGWVMDVGRIFAQIDQFWTKSAKDRPTLTNV